MTPMQSRMPSILYTIVDTPLRAEGRRISGPPAAGPVLVCYNLCSYVPGFTSSVYANVMPHAVRVSVALVCLRAKARKALCPHRWRENVRSRRGACARCTPSRQQWAASVADDTHAPLEI